MAFVTLHPSKASQWENKHEEFQVDLKAHARKRLPGFATPEWVAIVPELPVSEKFVWAVLSLVTFSPSENLYREDSESGIAQEGC